MSKKDSIGQADAVQEKKPLNDHWFAAGSSGISSLQLVHRGVEVAVQWACEVVRWQELSGQAPGSFPAFEVGEGTNTQADGFDEQMQCSRHACEAFEKITRVFAQSMRERWASALANNIDAMDLRGDQSAVASILRHAQESACMCPVIHADAAAKKNWRKAFGRAKWKKFEEGKPLYAHLALLSVAVFPGMDDPEDDMEVTDESDEEVGLQNMLKLNRPVVHPDELDADGLIDSPHAMRLVAKKALEMSAVSREHFAGAIALPRLFSHEELEQVSFQSLHDIPQKVLGVLDLGASEKDMENLVLQMLNRGIGGCVLSDMDLLARSRIHYVITVVYTQEPGGDHAALKGMGPWPNSVESEDALDFDEALAPAISVVMQGEMEISVASIDLFFHALRDGVRRQRAQAMLEQIAMTLKSADAVPEECYFVIENEKDPELIAQSLVLELLDGWFKPIASLSWPMVTFDDPYDQAAHLQVIAQTLGFRPRSDVFVMKQEGFA